MFKIKDIDFTVSSARLYGRLRKESLKWRIEVRAKPLQYRGETWEPYAYSEDLFSGFSVSRDLCWRDLLNNKVTWGDCYDQHTGLPHASLYVFGHEAIYESTLKLHVSPAKQCELDWSARCNVYFDDDYREGLLLRIRTPFVFEGIYWHGEGKPKETTIRELIARHLNPVEFISVTDANGQWQCFRPIGKVASE